MYAAVYVMAVGFEFPIRVPKLIRHTLLVCNLVAIRSFCEPLSTVCTHNVSIKGNSKPTAMHRACHFHFRNQARCVHSGCCGGRVVPPL